MVWLADADADVQAKTSRSQVRSSTRYCTAVGVAAVQGSAESSQHLTVNATALPSTHERPTNRSVMVILKSGTPHGQRQSMSGTVTANRVRRNRERSGRVSRRQGGYIATTIPAVSPSSRRSPARQRAIARQGRKRRAVGGRKWQFPWVKSQRGPLGCDLTNHRDLQPITRFCHNGHNGHILL